MSQLKLNSAAHAATLKYTGTENVDIDCKNVALDDYTLLADYVARKYNGTITLSEDLTNFKELVVYVQYFVSPYFKTFTSFPVELMKVGETYEFSAMDNVFARWTYTNTTTFTFYSENVSWIRAVYGKGRIA